MKIGDVVEYIAANDNSDLISERYPIVNIGDIGIVSKISTRSNEYEDVVIIVVFVRNLFLSYCVDRWKVVS